MDVVVKDIRDDKRWQLEAKLYGKDLANSMAMIRISHNKHYGNIRQESERMELWKNYISTGAVNDLVTIAKNLFESIENETVGVIKFVPGMKVWDEGPYRFVDSSGKGKKGFPIFRYVRGSDGLAAHLCESSDVEGEIWRRVANRNDKISREVEVFRTSLSPEILNDVFEKYPRDFGSTNGMPRRVESAFNHIPSLKRSLKVKGFTYPHKVSSLLIG